MTPRSARLPDVNAGEQARLRIKTTSGDSAPVAARIGIEYSKRVLAHQQSSRKVGNKGELSVDVAQAAPRCGSRSPLFVAAEVHMRKRRFGDAEIVNAPKPLCDRCKPVVVRWYHEPTGQIDFEVLGRFRLVEGVCPARKR
ncbi:MAG: hypothetical protein R3E83_01785 [Burkholderiaceae bacterium]